MTTPVVSALKNYHIKSFLGVTTGVLGHFWIQVEVSEAKRAAATWLFWKWNAQARNG
jgi:hypothetical protein